jgi:hypothetical protein
LRSSNDGFSTCVDAGSSDSIFVNDPADASAFSPCGGASGVDSATPNPLNSCVNVPGLFSAAGGGDGALSLPPNPLNNCVNVPGLFSATGGGDGALSLPPNPLNNCVKVAGLVSAAGETGAAGGGTEGVGAASPLGAARNNSVNPPAPGAGPGAVVGSVVGAASTFATMGAGCAKFVAGGDEGADGS